jgi:hypothetical protein
MSFYVFIYVEIWHVSNTYKVKILSIMDVLLCKYKYFITYITWAWFDYAFVLVLSVNKDIYWYIRYLDLYSHPRLDFGLKSLYNILPKFSISINLKYYNFVFINGGFCFLNTSVFLDRLNIKENMAVCTFIYIEVWPTLSNWLINSL